MFRLLLELGGLESNPFDNPEEHKCYIKNVDEVKTHKTGANVLLPIYHAMTTTRKMKK